MPSYVCPECGEPAIERLVIVEGTQMHYSCHLKIKAKARQATTDRFNAVIARQRARAS